MRYFYLNEFEYPKNCKWGPRPRQALLLSEEDWSRINDHLKLQKDEFIPSEHELRLAEKERKKQKSQEITSSWENTLVVSTNILAEVLTDPTVLKICNL